MYIYNIPNNEDIKAVTESYEKYKEKTVSTKVIITFLSLILTLKTLYLIVHTTYKQWAVPWVQYVLHPTRTSLWQILKQNTSIHTLKRSLCYTLDILTTYL